MTPDELAASVLLVLIGVVTAGELGRRALFWLARRVIALVMIYKLRGLLT